MASRRYKREIAVFLFALLMILVKTLSFLSLTINESLFDADMGYLFSMLGDKIAFVCFPAMLLSFFFLFKGIGKYIYLFVIDLSVSLLFIFDIMYYYSYGTFLSLKFLTNPDTFNPLNKQIFSFNFEMLFFLLDIILLIILIVLFIIKDKKKLMTMKTTRHPLGFLCGMIIPLIYIFVIQLVTSVIPVWKSKAPVFKDAWSPATAMLHMSPLGYHSFDIFKTLTTNENPKLSLEDKDKLNEWYKYNKEALTDDNSVKGILKGKNVIYLQVESLESFIVGRSVDGQPITPYLSSIIPKSIYFPNIYDQTAFGNCADADFMVNTSILPLKDDNVLQKYPIKKIDTFSTILKRNEYSTMSSRPAAKLSFDWTTAHEKSLKFGEVKDIANRDRNTFLGNGTPDDEYLQQVAQEIKKMEKPFYAFTATITNQEPYKLPDDKKLLTLPEELTGESEGAILGNYFQTVRYTDEAIKHFMETLDKEGLLDDTVVVIYGDHGGITKHYKDELANFSFDNDYWKPDESKVPVIIYNKDLSAKTIPTFGGLIDLMPTISYLLGIEDDALKYTMGKNLLITDRDCVILPSGTLIGTPINDEEKAHFESAYDIAELHISTDFPYNR